MLVSEIRPFLSIQIDDDSYDSVIEGMYAAAKRVFYNYTNHIIEEVDTSYTYINASTDVIYFHDGPVNSITSVQYASIFTDSLSTMPPSSYNLVRDILFFDEVKSYYKLLISYNAGYANIPDDLDYVLVQMLSFYFSYNDRKVYLSSDENAILPPEKVELPRYLKEQIITYKI